MISISKTHQRYPVLLIFVAAMLWASDAPFRVGLTESFSSEVIVLLEHTLALVLLTPFLALTAFREAKQLSSSEWLAVLFVGIGGSALALFLFTESFNYMNPSAVILLQKLQPLIAISLAMLVLKEITPLKFWQWAGISLLAAYVISFPDLVPRVYVGESFNPNLIGSVLALSAAGLWGASTVLGKYILNHVSFKTMAYLRFLVATVFLVFLNLKAGTLGEATLFRGADWLNLLVISIISGVVAMYIYYLGLAKAKASAATIAELGFPVAAVLVNYLFLDALLTWSQLAAMTILVYAVWRLNAFSRT